ncbi:hypothetical protein B0H16DRAFT_1485415 [Mycena metata]|uniref:Uncharacterized protein n=1 Tax=Mycena metata TaxID=1033252 RepID=A0AAD7GMQ1_9AGAR|nr:hypothetical protein B0H16DRAFT_1485415 [Mycena metata]
MSKFYDCKKCPLKNGADHQLTTKERSEHNRELAAYRATQKRDDELTTALSDMKIADSEDGLQDTAGRSVNALLANTPNARGTGPAKDKPVGRVQKRKEATMAAIDEILAQAIASLEVPKEFDAHNVDQVADMRSKLKVASESGRGAEKALHSLEDSSQKEAMTSQLRILEMRINVIGNVLPAETTTLAYDSSHLAQNPVEELDLIAQVMVLLGVVCHVIMRLGAKPTNFVLGTATLLIRLVMSLNPVTQLDGTETLDPQQEHVLEQLPSSLYIALQRFKIDGKTVQYAVCPSCHYTHPPNNPDSPVPRYPEKCTNRVVGKSGRTVCSTKLLTLRDGLVKP